jgi:hypothetical protein
MCVRHRESEEWGMAENWKSTPVTEVRAGDEIRLQSGRRLVVSRVEEAFMGRPEMIAFIQDTPDEWFKQPVPGSMSVEVLQTD